MSDGARHLRKDDAGRIQVTFRAKAELTDDEIRAAVDRHLHGDWGNVPTVCSRHNEESLRTKRGRVASLHRSASGLYFHLVTDFAMGVTLFVFDDEVELDDNDQVSWSVDD